MEPPKSVDDGLLPMAAAGKARLAATMTAAATCTVSGHPRRGCRMTRLLRFTMPPQGSMIVVAASVASVAVLNLKPGAIFS
jgi:hypothetical protein